jgi:uncharacterized protein (DUF58 family)
VIGRLAKFIYRASTLEAQVLRWRKKIARLLAKRSGRELPIELTQKRLYVLPTGFGVMFAILLFAALAGALNFNNNLALGFGFFFAALAFLSVHVAHRNLLRVRLEQLSAEPFHAGDQSSVIAKFRTSDQRERTCLQANFEDAAVTEFELPEQADVPLGICVHQRGWVEPPPILIATRWPFGYFQVWSHLWPSIKILVFPRLEVNPPPLPLQDFQSQGAVLQDGDDELKSLRQYREGDPLRSIAWRASSRQEQLLVREQQTPIAHDVRLEYHALAALSHEQKISRLASWCVQAEQAGQSFGLTAPGFEIPIGRGVQHLRQCLQRLAELP